MSEEREMRCPYCNGVGRLPHERVQAIEADRDEFAVRKEIAMQLWGALSDILVESRKKKATLESVRARLQSAHSALRPFMTLDRISGQ